MTNKIPPEIEEEILKEVLKKYLGTSKDLTSFDKCIREMFEEDKLYPAKPIIEQVKGMYNDSAENMRLAVKQAISLAFQEGQKQKVDDVLKLIDDLIEKRGGTDIAGAYLGFYLNELKSKLAGEQNE